MTNTASFVYTTLNNRTAHLVGYGYGSDFDSHRGTVSSTCDFAVLRDTATGHTFNLSWDVVLPQVISQGLVPVVSDKHGSRSSKTVDTYYGGVHFDDFGGTSCEHSTTSVNNTFIKDVINWLPCDYSQPDWTFDDFTTYEESQPSPTIYSTTWVTCVPAWFKSAHAEWVDEAYSRAVAKG